GGWGRGRVGREGGGGEGRRGELTGDRDAEVRAQAAKVLGEGRVAEAYGRLLPLLADAEPRVRFFAALAVGKLKRREAVPAVVQMLRDNADRDAYLRHAGVMALTWIDDEDALRHAAEDSSPAVPVGALLARRRPGKP